MLVGKAAIITGSSSGIGLGIAVRFAQLGCQITLHGRNHKALEDAKQQCLTIPHKETDILVVDGDITSASLRSRLIEETVKKFGKIDILVNNAGISAFNLLNLDGSSRLDTYHTIFDTNVVSIINLTQKSVPHLIETKGNIINISSISGVKATFGCSFYCMSKAATDMYTKCMAQELGPHGIRVNAISPGVVKTPLIGKLGLSNTIVDTIAQKNPLKRLGVPKDIADSAAFLASDHASCITGVNLVADCGSLVTADLQLQ